MGLIWIKLLHELVSKCVRQTAHESIALCIFGLYNFVFNP